MKKRELAPATLPDWKRRILDQFRVWLDELTEEERDRIERETEYDRETPDLYTFFSELATLKQDIRLQSRTTQQAGQKIEGVSTSLREELAGQLRILAETAVDLKSHISTTRREAQNILIVEILNIRESIDRSVRSAADDRLPRRPWLRRAARISDKIKQDHKMLLDKTDDALRRLNVSPIVAVGDAFDAKLMSARDSSRTGAESGVVTKILRQGHIRDGRILQMAEVEVKK